MSRAAKEGERNEGFKSRHSPENAVDAAGTGRVVWLSGRAVGIRAAVRRQKTECQGRKPMAPQYSLYRQTR
ncbi:hypothetical protein D3C87_1753670 [compost metagenome]